MKPCDIIRLKELEAVLSELQAARFFDVFAFNGAKQRWSCFACNHPERVVNFLNKEGNSPVIEVILSKSAE